MGTLALLVLCTPHGLEESSLVLVALLLTQEAVHPEDLTQVRICGLLVLRFREYCATCPWSPGLRTLSSPFCSVCSPTINTHWHWFGAA